MMMTHTSFNSIDTPPSQAVFSAGAKLTVRALRTSNSSLVIVFWMSGLSSILAGLACKILPNHFIGPRDRMDWLLLLATGVSGLLHQVGARHSACIVCTDVSRDVSFFPSCVE